MITFLEISCDEEKLLYLEIEDSKLVAINENLFNLLKPNNDESNDESTYKQLRNAISKTAK